MIRVAFTLLVLVACGRYGYESQDANDAADDAVDPDGDPSFAYIEWLEPGWTVDVFMDFSGELTYSMQDFVDGPETYDNRPTSMFTLRSPYPDELCVIAGRKLLELTPNGVVFHDYGNHLPDDFDLPDAIRMGVWTSSINSGNPGLVITSSSDGGGDGIITISTQWLADRVNPQNNTRAFAWDPTGAFDGVGTPQGYMAAAGGVYRFSDSTMLFPGDTKSIQVIGPDLYLTRTVLIDVDVRLIRVSAMVAGMYPEVQLAQASSAKLGEGTPAGGIAWVTFDETRLSRLAATGTVQDIAHITEADTQWNYAVTPPTGHPLRTADDLVYLLETNIVTGRFRVLVLHGPG